MDRTLRLIQHNWVVLAYNFNVVILVLIIGESSIGAFLLTILLQFYLYYYLALLFYPYTYWVPTISVLNFVIFLCYSNMLLRRRCTGILRRRVLAYVLPRLLFLWSYGVFHCSILLRVVIVFKDITYVIILLYSWYLVIYEHFWPYVWNNWSWIMHTMNTWFWHKNRVWHTTNEPNSFPCLCELSPTPLCEVCVICEKSKLGLSEILFVSTWALWSNLRGICYSWRWSLLYG
jgi:hypothetical protein